MAFIQFEKKPEYAMAFIKQNFTIKKDQKYYRITALKTLK
jgi:hypothetical protein